MTDSWQWTFFVQMPCLLANLFGAYLALFGSIPMPKARMVFWLNIVCMFFTIANMLFNSWLVVAKYQYGEG